MKLPSYKEILDGATEESVKPFRMKAARKKAELKAAEIEERIAKQQEELNTACSQKELNFDDIINRMDKLELEERRLKQMNEILTQLFPDETK